MRRLALAAALAVAAAAPAASAAEPGSCAAPRALSDITVPLKHSAALIAAGKPLLIVAVGSSSTSGVGASTPAAAYPERLAIALRHRFPRAHFRVLNRGKGGEDAGEEFARLQSDVVAARPDLVIWQVGTNAVLRRDDLAGDAILLDDGVAILKHDGVDVVLMDLQYAPRVLARRAYTLMETLIGETAAREHVGLYHRFAVMQYWQKAGSLGPLIGPDGLHMTDESYNCLAVSLADSLAANWNDFAKSLPHAPVAPDAVAGLHGKERLPPAQESPLP